MLSWVAEPWGSASVLCYRAIIIQFAQVDVDGSEEESHWH